MHRPYDPHAQRHAAVRRPFPWRALLVCAAVVWAATGFYAVQPQERAVVRRCGKALETLGTPGLHLGLPWGVDAVTRVKVLERKRVGVGMALTERALGRRADRRGAEYITGDRNLIQLAAVVQYRVADARRFLFASAAVPALVRSVAGSVQAAVVTAMSVDDVLTVERLAIQEQVKRRAQEILDRYGAGVEIAAVTLEEAAPPQEVAEAFRDVTSAREDRQRAINEAQGYANRLLPQARGEAQRVRLEAEAKSKEIVEKARGEADRFTRLAGEVAGGGGTARDVTLRRLLLEAMEEILPRLRKIVLDEKAAAGTDLGILEESE